ncbi:MAG TPA: PAS domain S-box protein [Deltaproteobacteria bacterium]|nr:PAS domain S-box protein [Deltaproteobacteria bacterium]
MPMIDKELTVFRRVNEAISLSPDVEAVAGAILDIVIDETIAENASIMMPSSDGRHLEIKAAKGALDKNSRFSEKSLGQVFAMGKGIAGSVALSLKPVIIHDAQKDPLFENKRTKVRIGSLMSMPLVYGRGELVAVLNLSHSRPHAFNERDLNLVNVLLPPAALALRNARAMKELEDINSLLKAELSMTDSALSEFGKNIFRIFTCMSVGVLTMDRNGTVTAINKKASELLGLEPGASMPSLVAEELVREPASEIREATRDIEHGGRILNIEVSSLPMKPDWQMLACVRDVTLERYKERELVRIKDQYKDMVENALDAMYIIKDGRFLLTNRKFQEMLGYAQDEILGRHFRRFVAKDSIRTLGSSLRLQPGDIFVPNLEIQAVRKDGKKLFIEISIGRLVIDSEKCYIGVVRDITSKKELLALKTRFLHVASHEIRVPLTVIRGYARMLSKDAQNLLSPSQKENIREIECQCEKLLHFSNSLLDFAKINTEKISLHKQEINVADYIGGIVRSMQIKAREKRVKILFDGGEDLPALSVDPLRFEQALCNLLDNAIKHSPEEGVVNIEVSRGVHEHNTMNKLLNRESLMISVQDQGPGIKPDEARELFSDFFVGVSGRAKGGIGLGLSITREIVHAHGGAVEALPAGQGGCFVITMPLNREDD